jgi:Flp pilus assembly protein TadD
LTTDVSRNRYQIQKAHFLLGRILAQQHRTDESRAEMQLARAFADKGLAHDKSELAGLLHNTAATGAQDASNDEGSGFGVEKVEDPTVFDKLTAVEKRLVPAIADSYNNLGAIAASGSKYDDAVDFFKHAAKWNPSLDGIDLNLGRAAFMASRFSEAVNPLTRYIKSHPEDSGVRGALAMSRFMTADYSGCIDALKGTEQQIATIPQMQFVYAESLVKTGQVASGREKLEALTTLHPEIADAHRGLGEALNIEGERQKAIAELETAIELNKKDPEARYDLGKAEVEEGDSAGAILELETAVRLLPGDPRFHRELAAAYKLGSRNEDAEKELGIYEKLSSPTAAKNAPEAASGK